jgi:hypothetical protein
MIRVRLRYVIPIHLILLDLYLGIRLSSISLFGRLASFGFTVFGSVLGDGSVRFDVSVGRGRGFGGLGLGLGLLGLGGGLGIGGLGWSFGRVAGISTSLS